MSNQNLSRRPIDFNALIVAYSMSRLDARFLKEFGYRTWSAADKAIGTTLAVKPSSVKNLRQEFDAFVDNSRRGWANRPMQPARRQVLDMFGELNDRELIALVRGILSHDDSVISEITAPLQSVRAQVFNVAQRLLTGRLAEQFFIRESRGICDLEPGELVDRRNDAVGFDFTVSSRPALMIEVKGLAGKSGEVEFTDLEFRTARQHHDQYWLVIVGNLRTRPLAKLHVDPCESLDFRRTVVQTPRTSWRSRVRVP